MQKRFQARVLFIGPTIADMIEGQASGIVKFDPWAGDGMFLNIGDFFLQGEEYSLFTDLGGKKPWEFILQTDDGNTEISLLGNAGEVWMSLNFKGCSASVSSSVDIHVAEHILDDIKHQTRGFCLADDMEITTITPTDGVCAWTSRHKIIIKQRA